MESPLVRKTLARTPVHSDGQKYRREAGSPQSPESPITTKVRSSARISSSDESDAGDDADSDSFTSIPSSPRPVSSVVLTPPPVTPMGVASPPPEAEDDIIVLDSDSEEDKENVRAPTVPRVNSASHHNYTGKDIKDLEGSIQKLRSAISQNTMMVATNRGRLPDGGKKLRDIIALDKAKLAKLRETLRKAKQAVLPAPNSYCDI